MKSRVKEERAAFAADKERWVREKLQTFRDALIKARVAPQDIADLEHRYEARLRGEGITILSGG